MLKPTDRPPPSLTPRFAASITPPPPPVTTAQPRSPKSRPVSRADAYAGWSSPIRAEPKIATAGRSIRSTSAKPRRNSSAIRATTSSGSATCVSRMRLSSNGALEPVLREVRGVRPDREEDRRPDVERARHERLVPPAALPEPARRAPHRAPVEDPDRDHVDQVQEEA